MDNEIARDYDGLRMTRHRIVLGLAAVSLMVPVACAPLLPEPPETTVAPTGTVAENQVSVAVPLMDMTANDRYEGADGGLYGKGLNTPPPGHRDAALRELAKIRPLDAQGRYSPDGKIVLISIGMSNASQEFSVFKRLADSSSEKASSLRIVDCAQGSQTARIWATEDQPWQVLRQRLQAAGVTLAQVQIVWVKQANSQPTRPFPAEAKELQAQLRVIMRRLTEECPNVKIAYLSSRTYGGYATTGLNPEPHAYESAYAVRWLIQDQTSGDPALNYNPDAGPVLSPLLLWGPYLWADGLNPRSDGVTWGPGDFSIADGTHPSDSGRQKVAEMLLDFFETNDLARPWFLQSP